MDKKIPTYEEYLKNKSFFDKLAETILDHQKAEKYNDIFDEIWMEKKKLKKIKEEEFDDVYPRMCWIKEEDHLPISKKSKL